MRTILFTLSVASVSGTDAAAMPGRTVPFGFEGAGVAADSFGVVAMVDILFGTYTVYAGFPSWLRSTAVANGSHGLPGRDLFCHKAPTNLTWALLLSVANFGFAA